nr:unnamed protein product [Digitaria exilis]
MRTPPLLPVVLLLPSGQRGARCGLAVVWRGGLRAGGPAAACLGTTSCTLRPARGCVAWQPVRWSASCKRAVVGPRAPGGRRGG